MVDTTSILNRIKNQHVDEVDELVNEFSEITSIVLSGYGYLQETESEEEALELTEFSTLFALNVIADILEETEHIPTIVLATIFEQSAGAIADAPAGSSQLGNLREKLKDYIQKLRQRLKEKLSNKKEKLTNLLKAKKTSIKRLVAAKFGDKLGKLGDKIMSAGNKLKKYNRTATLGERISTIGNKFIKYRAAKHHLDEIKRAVEEEKKYSRLLDLANKILPEGNRKEQRIRQFENKLRHFRLSRQHDEEFLKRLGF